MKARDAHDVRYHYYRLSQLQMLEAESVHILREVAAELERPVLLFSGGKDSLVMLRLPERRRAGRRAKGQVRESQPAADHDAARHGREAPVRRAVRRWPPRRGECACEGAGLLLRDEFGQWDPKVQRPELWNLYNGRINRGESIRRSRCRTGPSSTSGTTSPRSRSSCPPSTAHTRGRCSSGTGSCSPTSTRPTALPPTAPQSPGCLTDQSGRSARTSLGKGLLRRPPLFRVWRSPHLQLSVSVRLLPALVGD